MISLSDPSNPARTHVTVAGPPAARPAERARGAAWWSALRRAGRPLRFAAVGATAGAIQLGLLALLTARGLPAVPANTAAFLLAAQVNFALSTLVTWRDRVRGQARPAPLLRRWTAFHGSIAGTALLNQAVFLAARAVLPDLAASALGIALAAGMNYLAQDRVVFRRERPRAVAASAGAPTAERTTPAGAPFEVDGARRAASARTASVDVVIPVYNEQRVLATSIGTLHRFLSTWLDHDWRIVIADNASSDGTLAEAERLAATLPRVHTVHLDQKGRGRALTHAWLTSDADVLTYMDVDLSTDLAAFPALVRAVAEGRADLATGRRFGRGARVYGRRPLREVTSRGYNLLIAALFRPGFTDAQCGFKAISRRAARDLLPRVQDTNWFFDTELLLLAHRHGYRVAQVPVQWIDDPDSRVNVIATVVEDLKGLWRLKRAGV
jgi:putative flippase GtrA